MPGHNAWTLRRGRFGRACLLWAALAPMVSSARTPQPAPTQAPELVLQVGHAGAVNAIALSPDGRFLVSASDDSTIKIWDVATGNVLRTLYGHENAVFGVALSGDGQLVASGGEDGRVRVWNVTSGALRILGAHRQRVKELAFSPDARQLTSLGITELKVWDLATSRELKSTSLVDAKDMIVDLTGYHNAMALTADGRLAAVGGGYWFRGGIFRGLIRAQPVRVIEAATGRELDSFKVQGQQPTPVGLRFSRDGRVLVAKLHEMLTGAQFRSSLIVYERRLRPRDHAAAFGRRVLRRRHRVQSGRQVVRVTGHESQRCRHSDEAGRNHRLGAALRCHDMAAGPRALQHLRAIAGPLESGFERDSADIQRRWEISGDEFR